MYRGAPIAMENGETVVTGLVVRGNTKCGEAVYCGEGTAEGSPWVSVVLMFKDRTIGLHAEELPNSSGEFWLQLVMVEIGMVGFRGLSWERIQPDLLGNDKSRKFSHDDSLNASAMSIRRSFCKRQLSNIRHGAQGERIQERNPF